MDVIESRDLIHRRAIKEEILAIFFVLFESLRPINNLSVKQERFFLGLTSTKLG